MVTEGGRLKRSAFLLRKLRFYLYTILGRCFYHPKGECLFCIRQAGCFSIKKGTSMFLYSYGMRMPLQIRSHLRIFCPNLRREYGYCVPPLFAMVFSEIKTEE